MAQILQRRRHQECRQGRGRGVAILLLDLLVGQVGQHIGALVESIPDIAAAISSLGWGASLVHRSAGNHYQIARADVVNALGADLETLSVLNVDAATNRIRRLDHVRIDIQIVFPGRTNAARGRQDQRPGVDQISPTWRLAVRLDHRVVQNRADGGCQAYRGAGLNAVQPDLTHGADRDGPGSLQQVLSIGHGQAACLGNRQAQVTPGMDRGLVAESHIASTDA